MKILTINNYKINSINNNVIKPNFEKKPTDIQGNDSITINNKNNYPQAIAFEGVSTNGIVRQRGLYHHISALPAKGSFCGQFLDAETNKFIKFLAKAKQTHWIVNPLNELTEDMCPYNPLGRFGKNKYLVNMNILTDARYGKLLKEKELSPYDSGKVFDLNMLKTQKDPLFKLAYKRFQAIPDSNNLKKEYEKFCKKNDSVWLDTYATYDVISQKYGASWYTWPEDLIKAPENVNKNKNLDDVVYQTLKKHKNISKQSFENSKNLYKFEQFLFDKQFKETLDILKENHLKIMTDFPIGVCADGVDTWANKNMFLLNKKTNKPLVVTGCPSQKGDKPFTQVWGHAQLDFNKKDTWKYLENSLNQMLEVSDVRLDHFAAYANRAEIPTRYVDANGKVYEGNDIFKEPPFGMGSGFFDKNWIQDIASFKNKNNNYNENIFDMFIRLAKENNKDVKDAYMIESLGKLTKEPAYIERFEKIYGDHFTHQRAVFPKNFKDSTIIEELDTSPRDFVVLTSNHDKPALRECIKDLIQAENEIGGVFTEFCKNELKLAEDTLTNIDKVQRNLMEWFYTRFNKHHIHTTLMDALSLEGRFNIPGTTNASEERYFMSPTPEGLIGLWTQVMPKDFLNRIDRNGNHSGYKDRADEFINLQTKLNTLV